MQDIEQFIDLVKRMRQAQKDYFRTRNRTIMQHSMGLERAVDKCIIEYEENKKDHPKQLDLFAESD